jgi:phage shock protein A
MQQITPEQQQYNDLISVVQRQRDQALNSCVQLEALIMKLERDIIELKKPKEVKKPKEEIPKTE